ncbi:2478_t:CDS:10 [Paraglomus brasilianum]|uniref:2478_t:CDS:1 n=1 Tax=Paraglomus brasilianum TaxID=144538 RepID=A0A9N9FK96_9GLOM|nr:2478_t:CDS:10 [Paraglomus brasilianum]
MDALKELEDTLEKTKVNVYETILSDFSVVDLQETVSPALEKLRTQLAKLQAMHRPNLPELTDECVSNSKTDKKLIQRRVDAADFTLSMLLNLVKLHAYLEEYQNLIDTGEFGIAASSLKEMREMLDNLSLEGEYGCDPSIYALIKDSFLKKRSVLIHYIDELFSASLSIANDNKSAEIRVAFSVKASCVRSSTETSIPLSNILSTLSSMGCLKAKLKGFSNKLLEYVVAPIMSETGCEIKVSKNGNSAMLSCNKSPKPSETVTLGLSQVFTNMLILARFLNEYVFSKSTATSTNGASIITVFGEIWWHDIWKHLANCFRVFIPNDKVRSNEYDEVATTAISFEREMMAVGLIPSDCYAISQFAQNFQFEFVKKRHADILAIAREILVSQDMNTAEVTNATERGGLGIASETKNIRDKENFNGEKDFNGKTRSSTCEGLLHLPTCHISIQAQTLVELVYQTLTEATTSKDNAAVELYCCARDIIDLFRAVVPIHQAEVLETDPTRTAIFYNDCIYISYHMLTLGYQFQKELPASLQKSATFIDLIPHFQKLGEKYFKHQMRRQRDVLLNTLKGAEGFYDLNDDKRFEKVEKTIRQCYYQLNHLSRSWKQILPTELCCKSLGILVDTLLGGIIGEAESWFEIVKIKGGLSRKKTTEQVPIHKYVSCWDKYWQLSYILGLDLPELSEKLQKTLEFKDFTTKEIQNLVEALFVDSPDRKRLISTLR